jgi:hypothetical protein
LTRRLLAAGLMGLGCGASALALVLLAMSVPAELPEPGIERTDGGWPGANPLLNPNLAARRVGYATWPERRYTTAECEALGRVIKEVTD